jgi:hypothetical protein
MLLVEQFQHIWTHSRLLMCVTSSGNKNKGLPSWFQNALPTHCAHCSQLKLCPSSCEADSFHALWNEIVISLFHLSYAFKKCMYIIKKTFNLPELSHSFIFHTLLRFWNKIGVLFLKCNPGFLTLLQDPTELATTDRLRTIYKPLESWPDTM